MTDFAEDVPDAPRSTNPALLRSLAADLAALNYTVDGVAELIGADANAALDRGQPVPALLACRTEAAGGHPNPLAVVVLLLLLGGTADNAQLNGAFPAAGADGLEQLGLIERAPGAWRAAVDLRPHATDSGADLWVASDFGSDQRPGVLRADHVLGIGQASLTLAQLTTRKSVDRALDLGTGCGIQTFHLLRHAAHVTATDISARALAFTRFNLLLNAEQLEIDPDQLGKRVSLRLGSLLEPVEGETFDQVVSNPPFVITPRGNTAADRFTYRDGGLPGDDIVATLMRTIPGILAPGGTAQLLGNWEIPQGSGWPDRIRTWIPPHTDAWFVQREQLSPVHYAETWLRDAAENREPERFEHRFADYLADFASRRVQAIGFGLIWLRKAGPGNAVLSRFEELTHEIEQPIGHHLADAVERCDWLEAHPNLEEHHLLVAEDVTEERHQRPGAEHPGVILLRQGAGFRRTTLLSTELAGFVSACDGDLTAGQIAGALGALLDRDDDGFRTGLLGGVRQLVEEGFLMPAGSRCSQAGPAGR